MVLLCAHHQEKYHTYAKPGICHSETSGEFKITRVYVIKWCYYVPIIRRKYRTYATPGICYSETSGEFKITRVYVIKWCYYVPIIRRNTVPMRHLVFVTLKQVESLKLEECMS